MVIIIITGFIINMQLQGQHPHQWAPFQVACYMHGRSNTRSPDVSIMRSIVESFHSLRYLSVSCFHVILGPRFPSTYMSQADLTVPLECSTCPYQRSLLSFRMRSRISMPSWASSSLDLTVTVSCGLTLHISLIIALTFRCRFWRFFFVNGQVSLAWSIALHTQELYTWPRVLKERWQEERTG